MKTIYHLYLISIFSLSMATTSVVAQTSYSPIKQVYCVEKPSEFYLFYEGENLPFKYEKIGEVSVVENSYYFRDADLLNNLKYYAWKNCANGLLFIKSGYTGSEETVKYYSAVAVRIDTDSDFKIRYGSGADMSFVQVVEQKRIQEKSQRKAGAGLSLMAILVAIFLLTQLEFS